MHGDPPRRVVARSAEAVAGQAACACGFDDTQVRRRGTAVAVSTASPVRQQEGRMHQPLRSGVRSPLTRDDTPTQGAAYPPVSGTRPAAAPASTARERVEAALGEPEHEVQSFVHGACLPHERDQYVAEQDPARATPSNRPRAISKAACSTPICTTRRDWSAWCASAMPPAIAIPIANSPTALPTRSSATGRCRALRRAVPASAGAEAACHADRPRGRDPAGNAPGGWVWLDCRSASCAIARCAGCVRVRPAQGPAVRAWAVRGVLRHRHGVVSRARCLTCMTPAMRGRAIGGLPA